MFALSVADENVGSCIFFFFQAEDGIRDLVRSRGLGDVYKRQVPGSATSDALNAASEPDTALSPQQLGSLPPPSGPVSYTHLTLPTSDLV